MKLVTALIAIALAGCNQIAPPINYCTEDQMRRVERETTFCKQNTENYGWYCYNAAIARNCTPIKECK